MWGKVCSVAMEQWSIDFEGKPKSQEPLLRGCDPLSPFPDLYPVCSHQAAFVCMFSPAATTHLLAGTLADPVQILSLSVCVPAKYFISVCIVGCCRLEDKRHARGRTCILMNARSNTFGLSHLTCCQAPWMCPDPDAHRNLLLKQLFPRYPPSNRHEKTDKLASRISNSETVRNGRLDH